MCMYYCLSIREEETVHPQEPEWTRDGASTVREGHQKQGTAELGLRQQPWYWGKPLPPARPLLSTQAALRHWGAAMYKTCTQRKFLPQGRG